MDFKTVNLSKQKKAQVTLFVILGIIMVSVIIFLTIILINLQKDKTEFLNPKQYIETCIQEELSRPLDKIFNGGGFVNPENFILYQNEKYNYLCYTPNFGVKCNTLYPQLKRTIEQEIKNEIQEEVSNCFAKLKEEYEKKGYSVNEGALDLNVEITANKIIAVAKRKIELLKGDELQIFDNFGADITRDLYDLLGVVQDIVSEEAKYGKFEYMGYLLSNPEYKIKFIEYSDNSLYRIRKSDSTQEFRFATKGMAHWRGEINEE